MLPLGVTAAESATDTTIQNKIYGSGIHSIDNLKQRNERYETAKCLEEFSLVNKNKK